MTLKWAAARPSRAPDTPPPFLPTRVPTRPTVVAMLPPVTSSIQVAGLDPGRSGSTPGTASR